MQNTPPPSSSKNDLRSAPHAHKRRRRASTLSQVAESLGDASVKASLENFIARANTSPRGTGTWDFSASASLEESTKTQEAKAKSEELAQSLRQAATKAESEKNALQKKIATLQEDVKQAEAQVHLAAKANSRSELKISELTRSLKGSATQANALRSQKSAAQKSGGIGLGWSLLGLLVGCAVTFLFMRGQSGDAADSKVPEPSAAIAPAAVKASAKTKAKTPAPALAPQSQKAPEPLTQKPEASAPAPAPAPAPAAVANQGANQDAEPEEQLEPELDSKTAEARTLKTSRTRAAQTKKVKKAPAAKESKAPKKAKQPKAKGGIVNPF